MVGRDLAESIAGVAAGMEAHRHDASVAQLPEVAGAGVPSRGGRKPVLAVGRDGLMLPIRGEACYREGRRRPSRSTIGRDGDWGRCTSGGCPSQGKRRYRAIDSLDRGGVARNGTGHCRGWPTSRTGETIRPGYSAGFSSGCDPHHPRPAAEMGMGHRLLSRVRIHLQTVGGLVFRLRAGSAWARKMCRWLKKSRGRFTGLTFGGGDPAAADGGG